MARFKIAKVAHLGGIATREALTPAERTAYARMAARARWKRTPKAARSEAARTAVLARWARARVKPQKST